MLLGLVIAPGLSNAAAPAPVDLEAKEELEFLIDKDGDVIMVPSPHVEAYDLNRPDHIYEIKGINDSNMLRKDLKQLLREQGFPGDFSVMHVGRVFILADDEQPYEHPRFGYRITNDDPIGDFHFKHMKDHPDNAMVVLYPN